MVISGISENHFLKFVVHYNFQNTLNEVGVNGSQGYEGGSVGKTLDMQLRGPEFRSSEPM